MISRASALGYTAVAVAAFGLGYSDVDLADISDVPAWLRYHQARQGFEARYEPTVDPFYSGEEVVMVYVGRRYCAPSNALDLPQHVEDMKAALGARAAEDGHRFRAIGVAIDPLVADGLSHLEKFGAFDEVHAGGGAFSDAAMTWMWQTFPGEVSTPQVLVVRRSRRSPADRLAPPVYALEDARLVERIVGLDGITARVRAMRAAPDLPPNGGEDG